MRLLKPVAAIVSLFLATIAVSVAAHPAAAFTANVTGYDVHGHALPPDPAVVIGETFVVVATGFQPVQHVRADRPGYPSADLVADRQGDVRLVYHVPRGMPNGNYSIAFVAVAGRASSHPGTPTTTVTPATTDTQGVEATVPPFAVYPFRLDDPGQTTSASVSAGSTSRRGGSANDESGAAVSATTINAGSTPAYTGADLLEPLIVGVAGVTTGIVIAMFARRRRKGEHVV